MSENQTPENATENAPLFEGSLFLSPHIDYFRNGDDFFVYHNLYGYIIQMSEDLVDFLEFFGAEPRNADDVLSQFSSAFDRDTLNNFLSVFRPLACILPDDQFEPTKSHDMYPVFARWITVDGTDPKAIVIYAFDTQAQNRIIKISLNAWESRLWSHITGDKTVGEIAQQIAEEDGAPVADVELQITASLALWSHCSIQAVKMSAQAVKLTAKSRFGIPPYLISTMPFERVTAAIRTEIDDQGNIVKAWEEPVRCMPEHMEIIELDADTIAADRNCARLSSMLEKPHAVLRNRAYGQAVFDTITQYAPVTGECCKVLEVGGGFGATARDFLKAAAAQCPDTRVEYTLFTNDEEHAAALRAALASIDNIRIVSGDIEKIAEILDGEKFDIIYSDEFLANLPSVAVRKMSLGGNDDEEEEDEDDDLPDDGERKPVHASENNDKVTYIGEGDAVQLIFKYKLNLCDSPEDFILNSGSLRLLGNLAKLASFNTQMFLVEFGEDIKYPTQTMEDGKITYSQHFGVLKQAAKKLGFLADSRYWMEELDIDRDLPMFATTRSHFKALRQLLADHGVTLERRPYTQDEFNALLATAAKPCGNIVELNFEPAEDRISGLVPHAYKMLRVYKELEF